MMALAWLVNNNGGYVTDLGSDVLRLSVYWRVKGQKDTNGPYAVTVFGRQLKEYFETVEEAQARAETLARRLIKKAVDILETDP